ncbi:uncharacterized protein PADG_04571 [Paracoccidioides brasiliensis Pb18]|uniref:Uncharacterized protein n=1 Tax=Paracoccidioides brasiliensis (strain Pb18) TaxID=502780 RepID=C1GC49_PARBD|nr:uncharacterized protein PADG_04571 [Paracoccidioides brasiliensis Pb18]EEH48492.2 hypothetical protein PADG_04571 [Paracoccidioides brasiliensis Pb18]
MTHATAAVESSAVEATTGQEIPSRVCDNDINPIDYWIQRGYWPKKYFRQEGQQGISVCKGRSRHLLFTASNRNLARSPAPPHLVIKRQGTKKVLLYGNPLYQTILESKGSLMKEARGGITDESSTLIESSLAMAPTVPENSLFRDDLSDTTCEKVQRGNEARVIRDIGLLIVPSAAILDTRSAFTDDQLEKLKPFIDGRVALDIADRQNAYSMTLAQSGYSHYAVLEDDKTTLYRHPIRKFDFTE